MCPVVLECWPLLKRDFSEAWISSYLNSLHAEHLAFHGLVISSATMGLYSTSRMLFLPASFDIDHQSLFLLGAYLSMDTGFSVVLADHTRVADNKQ